MRAVGVDPGRAQRSLASRLHISPSRMVAIVDRLEARSLIERRPQPGDRRVRNLFLTPRGHELLETAFRAAIEHEQRVSSALSDAERTQLLELLDRVSEALELPPGAHTALREPD